MGEQSLGDADLFGWLARIAPASTDSAVISGHAPIIQERPIGSRQRRFGIESGAVASRIAAATACLPPAVGTVLAATPLFASFPLGSALAPAIAVRGSGGRRSGRG